MPRFNRFSAASALAAALSLIATPAFAVDLPHPGRVTVHAADDNAAMSRHGHWGRYRHRGGIDGGDVLAGVLILGGIAAVASAVGNSNNRDGDYRDYPPPPPPPPPPGRYDYRAGPAGPGAGPVGSSSGLDRAADICADAIERSIDPVGSIDSVRRGPSGWDVDGSLQDGTPFTCSIGNDGQIHDIQTDRNYRGAAYDSATSYDDSGYGDQSYRDNQYDDGTYARLRESRNGLGG
jgi:hypothetical protein